MKKLFIIHILLAMPLLAWCDSINFADAEVKTICVKNWDTNGDGELSKAEAASVTDLGKVFQSNKSINSFDELQYFTGLTIIGEFYFASCSNLISITIPNSVTSIGFRAFEHCISLTSVTIPNSVTSIGGSAFVDCFNLTSINIPNSVTTIGNSTFANCDLTSITIPNSVTSIGVWAFSECSTLKYIKVESTKPFIIDPATFPSNVIIFVPKGCKEAYQSADVWKDYIISDQNPDEAIAFADAKVKKICVMNWDTNGDGELSYIEAASVSSIQQVFSHNTDITSFDELQYFIGLYDNSINQCALYRYAFRNCSNLESVKLPYNLRVIEDYAFDKCSNLKSIKLPDNLESIYSFAFAGCRSLTSIVIPKSVGCIAAYTEQNGDKNYYNPFTDCSSLSSIIVEDGNKYYDSRGNCNAIIAKTTNTLVSGCKNTIIPNSVKIIGFHAFRGCEGLTSIVIPDFITKICGGAFTGCNNLISITLGSGIRYLEEGDSFGWYDKNKWSGMFEGCTSLKKVIIKDFASWFDVLIKYSKSNPLSIAHHLYSDENTEITDLVIPNGVERINSNAFVGCSFLKSLTIPNSVTSIGENAFSGCSSLTSVVIPNSVTSIGENAFSGCSSLTSVVIPNSVTSIGWGAFEGCSSLTSVAIPNSVTEIGGAFRECTRLSAIVWDADFVMPSDIVNKNTANLLFYTKDASYAPSSIKNVIVNGTAKEIVLSDASSSNNFYCPKEFTAEKISYTHNYRMTSGLDGQARGWETIALPFTVSEITHSSKGKLLPFGSWTSTSDAKPFWLCKLSSSGFTRATSIEANTPYIICMPNNSDYDSSFNLSGNVTFSATNVKVPVSSSVTTSKSNSKTFIPAFCAQDKSSTVYALNVNNSYHSELGGYTEGSAFVSDLRKVSPFEAYMTTSDSNAKRAFLIDFSEATGIDELPAMTGNEGKIAIYNLSGQHIITTDNGHISEVKAQLPAGIYIINGKKRVIKR